MTFRTHFLLPLCCVLVVVGCGEQTPSDSSDGIKDQVALIVKLRDEIRDGFTSGDVDAAHGPLHEVGHELNKLSDIAAKSGLSDETKKEIEDHVNTLMDAFGGIDKTLHGQDGSIWEDEADTIKEAMDQLVQISKSSP